MFAEMEKEYLLGIQALFLGGITAGYHSLNMDTGTIQKYLSLVARFISCLLMSQFLELACSTLCTAAQTRRLPELKWKDKYRNSLYALGASVAVLACCGDLALDVETVLILIACAVARYLEAKRQLATITYGEGMACSFSEGYLYQVIPSDGAMFWGLNEHIRELEEDQGVVFPVRRLLIVITKSLYCPPNLEAFNSRDPNLPHLEACRSLRDVQRDVAGVAGRVYRNTVYKLRRGARDARPPHVVAECATPLHTLWKVLQRRSVYHQLALADGAEISAAFCATLTRVVAASPELRGKCELVYYDDQNENLAEVLLAKVREIEPNFEAIIGNENVQ